MTHCSFRSILKTAFLLVLLPVSATTHAAILYVSPAGSHSSDGSSWERAFMSPQTALSLAQHGDEVWVAAGEWSGQFTVADGVGFYGGFRGNEYTRDQRDPVQNVTTLKGVPGWPVVHINNSSDSTTIVSGFTVVGPAYFGIYCGKDASPIIRGNVVTGCTTGIHASNCGTPIIEDNTVKDCLWYGIVCLEPAGTAIVRRNNVFDHLYPGLFGSGSRVEENWFASSSQPLRVFGNALFLRNRVSHMPGIGVRIAFAVLAGGNVFDSNGTAVEVEGGQPRLINNTFAFNEVALSLQEGAVVANNIFAYSGTAVDFAGTDEAREHMVLANSCFHANDRDLANLEPGPGDVHADPEFADPGAGDFHLSSSSMCVDAGDNAWLEGVDLDLDGQPRIQGGTVDIGADESDCAMPGTTTVVYVSNSGSDLNDGRSWATSKASLGDALQTAANLGGGEVWAAAGDYLAATIPPQVDLYGGFAGDEGERSQSRPWLNRTVVRGHHQGVDVLRVANWEGTTRIAGLNVEVGRDGIVGSYLEVRNCTLRGLGGRGISIGTAGVAENNAVYGCGVAGLAGSGRFANNTVIRCGAGLSVTGDADIHNNILAYNGTGVASGEGAEQEGGFNCLFGNAEDYAGMLPFSTDVREDPLLNAPDLGDVHLSGNSPCIDAGLTSAASETEDFDGEPRVQGTGVDIGVDEWNGTPPPPVGRVVLHVRTDGDDANDGLTWETAKATIVAAGRAASPGTDIWVAKGTYPGNVLLLPLVNLYGGFAGGESDPAERPSTGAETNISFGMPLSPFPVGLYTVGVAGGYRANVVDRVKTVPAGDAWQVYAPGSSPIMRHCVIQGGVLATGPGTVLEDSSIWTKLECGDEAHIQNCLAGGVVKLGQNALLEDSEFHNATVTAPGGVARHNLFEKSTLAGAVEVDGNEFVDAGTLFFGQRDSQQAPAVAVSGDSAVTGNTFTNCAFAVSAATRGQSSTLVAGNSLRNCNRGIFASGSGHAVIASNSVASAHTGIEANSSQSTVMNNTVLGAVGAAIVEVGSYGRLANNLLTRNKVGVKVANSSVLLERNCLWDNGRDYDGVPPGESDIHKDPLLESVLFGKVHLAPESPCVDAGVSDSTLPWGFDLDGEPRKQGEAVDIGADESDGVPPDYQPVIKYVRSDAEPGGDGSSWAAAYGSLFSAVNALGSEGGIIRIAQGGYSGGTPIPSFVYVEGGYRSEGDGPDERNPYQFAAGISNRLSMSSGYRIAAAEGIRATRIELEGGPILRNNRLFWTPSMYQPTLISCTAGAPLVQGNRVQSLLPRTGIGIECLGLTEPTISNNEIAGTSIALIVDGGGILANNTIVDNNFGILFHEGSDPALDNNIVAFNKNGILNIGGNPVLRNNCFYNGTYTDYGSLPPGPTDIRVDPLFRNREAGDYHLRPDSPCVDAGDTSRVDLAWTDIDWEPRVSGSSVDIGADEVHWVLSTLAEAKLSPDWSAVEVSGPITTATFGSEFYTESEDRSSGLMFVKSVPGVVPGDRIHALGTMRTAPSGERYLDVNSLDVVGTGQIVPLFMRLGALGGGDWHYDAVAGSGQRGVEGGIGLNNIGLLVRVAGLAGEATPEGFVLTDASRGDVRVSLPVGVSPPPAGSFVVITGISSCAIENGKIVPRVRVRTPHDVVGL